MKSHPIITALTAVVLLASCTSANINMQNDPVKFHITIGDLSNDATKAIKTSWTLGDKVNVWFNGRNQKTPDLVLTYDGSTWNTQENNSVSYTDGQYCVAMYEGSNNLSQYSCNNGVFTTGHYPMICTCLTTYSYSQSTVTVQLSDWIYTSRLQIVVMGIDSADARNWTLSCAQLQRMPGIDVNVMKSGSSDSGQSPVVAPVAAANGVANADGVAFYFADVSSLLCDNYNFTLTKSGSNYSFHADKTIGTSVVRCTGIRIPFAKFTSADIRGIASDGVRWVQLWSGGPKFAEKNILADSPSDFGCCYTRKRYRAPGSPDYLNASWITPGRDHLQELSNAINGSESKVTYSRQTVNGQLCMKFTGKGLYLNNSIIIPAYSQGDYLYTWLIVDIEDDYLLMETGGDSTAVGDEVYLRGVMK